METNQASAHQQRNIRPYTKCNIDDNRPKDAQYQRSIQILPNKFYLEANLAGRVLPIGILRPQGKAGEIGNILIRNDKSHKLDLL
jgi:hypothetical protein